jgi:hypothetical protein
MPLNKVIVSFFILLFSFQLAPVQQVGSFLYNNQLMEEIPHSQDDSGAKYSDDSLKQLFYTFSEPGINEHVQGSFLTCKAVDVNITTRSSDDIQTPPPNYNA